MRVISVPVRIRWICVALLAGPFLAAWEALIVPSAPWWKIPVLSLGIAFGGTLAAILPAIWALWRGRAWVLPWLAFVAALWIALSLGWFIRFANTSAGFFTVLLAAYWMTIRAWIRVETGRSFQDPRVRWFQGLPKPIPDLSAVLSMREDRLDCRVGRIDEDGVFVFQASGSRLPRPHRRDRADLQLNYRGRTVSCLCVPRVSLDNGAGLGFQFAEMTADARKVLGDFIELLRGEGHV